MPVNEPKPVNPDTLVKDVINAFFSGLGTTTTTNKVTPSAPTVDPVAEANRLLKKAEEAASKSVNEADILIAIADRHIRIIETALAYQK
jgi:hypothetical protein